MGRDTSLSPLPKTFQVRVISGIIDFCRCWSTITRAVFDTAPSSTIVFFKTTNLNICQGVAVEIHPSAREAVALTVRPVVVKN
jgi:hypothetical protein